MFYSLLCLCPWGKPLYCAPKQDLTGKAGEKKSLRALKLFKLCTSVCTLKSSCQFPKKQDCTNKV